MLTLGQKIYICVYRSFEFFLMAIMTGISMLHAVQSNYFHLVDAMCNYWDNDLHLSYIKKKQLENTCTITCILYFIKAALAFFSINFSMFDLMHKQGILKRLPLNTIIIASMLNLEIKMENKDIISYQLNFLHIRVLQ